MKRFSSIFRRSRRAAWLGWMSLALLLPATAWAQTGSVQGVVRDEAGVLLPGVNVLLEGTTLGAATDLEGRYRIERTPAGAYMARASAVGFQPERRPVTVRAGEAATLDFVLRETALVTDEVVVTASRRAQRFNEVPVSMSLVLPRELDQRNIVSLDEALRYVPGVQMVDNEVNIRGSSGFSYNAGGRVLLLLDGMPLMRPDREGIPLEQLPLAQIEQVEILKGPGSALYGGGALGGVINVITRDYPETPETSLRLFGGAYEPVRYDVWRAAWDDADTPRPFGGGSFTHARRLGRKAGFWINVAYREDRGYTDFQEERDLDTFLKLGWRPSTALRFDLLGGWTRRKSDSFLYWNGLRDALNPGELEFGGVRATGTNDNLTNLFSLMPSFSHAVGASLFYAVKARLVGVVVQPLEDDGTPKPVDKGTTGLRYGGEAQVNWLPVTGLHLTVGATRDALATESSFFQPDSVAREARSQPETAVFAQAEQRLFDRLNVVAGLRYDVYEIDVEDVERKLSPKLNAAFTLLDGLTVRAAYGQGFRVPSLAERFVNDKSFFPLIPNLDLRPEESTSYEVGLRGLRLWGGVVRTQVDAALFWNNYENLVDTRFIPEEQAFQVVNLTRARIRGAEAAFDAASTDDRWTVGLGYTFIDADDLSGDDVQPLSFRSRHLLKASLTAPLYGPFSFGLDYRFASEPQRADSDFARFVPDADALLPIRVLDARLAARWRHVGLAVLVKNALEYYYVERPAILAPPRHVLLQLQADF